jgi:hypothetical protein
VGDNFQPRPSYPRSSDDAFFASLLLLGLIFNA